MSQMFVSPPGLSREQVAIELTRFALQKHYWESNVAADESIFDEPFFWFGAAEQEFSVDREAVLSLFRRFPGQVPRCSITDEDFHATAIAPDVYMVAGRFWVATDPASGVYIRFHQRISTCVRWREGKARICMLHLSIPYGEMTKDDVGFPTAMAQETRAYMQQQLEEQKCLLAEATADLADIYNTVSCGIIRLLRREGTYRLLTFNPALAAQVETPQDQVQGLDWSDGCSPFVVPEDVPLLRDSLERLRKPGDHSSTDYRIRTPSGRVLYVNASNTFLSRDENGDLIQRLTYDISRRVELETALTHLSFVDTLTDLFNRNRFNLDTSNLQQQEPAHLGVVCLDLNGLKEWNDRYGHIAGDALLHRTALHIAEVFPGKAYRVGGDEFVVLDDERSEAEFQAAVAQLRTALRQDRISISVGSCWRGEKCRVWEQCDEADKLMYQEKKEFYRGSDKVARRCADADAPFPPA